MDHFEKSHVTSYKIYKRLLFIFNHTWDDWLRWQTYWHTVLFGWLKNHQKKGFPMNMLSKNKKKTPWEKPPRRSLWNHHVARIWCRAWCLRVPARCPSVPCLFVIRAPCVRATCPRPLFFGGDLKISEVWTWRTWRTWNSEFDGFWWISPRQFPCQNGQVKFCWHSVQFLCWKHELKTG